MSVVTITIPIDDAFDILESIENDSHLNVSTDTMQALSDALYGKVDE